MSMKNRAWIQSLVDDAAKESNEYAHPPGENSMRDNDPFPALISELGGLLSRKQNYYGCGMDSLENALSVAEDGITPWVYQAARVREKMSRLKGLRGAIVSSEETYAQIRETLRDIAGHALVAIAVLEREKKNEPTSNQLPDSTP